MCRRRRGVWKREGVCVCVREREREGGCERRRGGLCGMRRVCVEGKRVYLHVYRSICQSDAQCFLQSVNTSLLISLLFFCYLTSYMLLPSSSYSISFAVLFLFL